MPDELASGVDSGLGDLDANTFAHLHVQAIDVELALRRGRREAYLVSAHGPRVVHAGERVAVRAVIRRFRGSLQKLTLRVPIPRAVRPGTTSVMVASPSTDSAVTPSLAKLFETLFGGEA